MRLGLLKAVTAALLSAAAGMAAVLFDMYAAWFLFGSGLFLTLYIVICLLLLAGVKPRVQRMLASSGYLSDGDGADVEALLTMPRGLPLAWAAVKETWRREPGGETIERARLLVVAGGRTVRFAYRLDGLRRGMYTCVSSKVTFGDVLHAVVKTVDVQAGSAAGAAEPSPPLVVLPRPLGGAWCAPDTSRQAGGSGWLLRDYAPGDPLRRIDWKSYARHRVWRTRQNEPEEAGELWLLLDDAPVPAEQLERLIAAAARVADVELTRGRALAQLVCGGRHVRSRLRGAAGLRAALLWLAELPAAAAPPAAAAVPSVAASPAAAAALHAAPLRAAAVAMLRRAREGDVVCVVAARPVGEALSLRAPQGVTLRLVHVPGGAESEPKVVSGGG